MESTHHEVKRSGRTLEYRPLNQPITSHVAPERNTVKAKKRTIFGKIPSLSSDTLLWQPNNRSKPLQDMRELIEHTMI